MTPHEERLVLELHSKWGNRWSRIARKIPGRTDNEIKNYWRTHMRKKAQERKKSMYQSSSSSSSSSLSNSSSSSSHGNSPTVKSIIPKETKDRSFYDTGGLKFDHMAAASETEPKDYSMDEIWEDIEFSEDDTIIKPVYDGGNSDYYSCQTMTSPVWDYCPVSLWMTDDEESNKVFPPIMDQSYSFYNSQENFTVTG